MLQKAQPALRQHHAWQASRNLTAAAYWELGPFFFPKPTTASNIASTQILSLAVKQIAEDTGRGSSVYEVMCPGSRGATHRR